jgi:hypothetical protein
MVVGGLSVAAQGAVGKEFWGGGGIMMTAEDQFDLDVGKAKGGVG